MTVSRRTSRRRRGSLIVVGTGITGVGQTTLEAVACMERAEKLFYAVVEPTTEQWIRQLNPTAASLTDLYGPDKPRARTYAQITARIVAAVRRGLSVCAAFYGHPGVLVLSSHQAIRRLRREGYPARMLAGVSADGCLFADLGINPGDRGTQSFEASDFLLARRRIDPTSDLLLWQIGVLGESTARQGVPCRPERLRVLVRRLLRQYPESHRVTLYYGATFPTDPPIVKRLTLKALATTQVWPMATLYVPGLPARRRDRRVLDWYASR